MNGVKEIRGFDVRLIVHRFPPNQDRVCLVRYCGLKSWWQDVSPWSLRFVVDRCANWLMESVSVELVCVVLAGCGK